MSWNPIVVGVDDSPEAAWAAALGAGLAQITGTNCHLVHASRGVVSAEALAELPERAEEFTTAQIGQARESGARLVGRRSSRAARAYRHPRGSARSGAQMM